MRLSDYLDDWLRRRQTRLRPTTHASYRQIINCYLRPHLGDHTLTSLDRPTLERAYVQLLTEGGRKGRPLAPKTVKYCHGILRTALEDAVIDGLLSDNPARAARPPRLNPADDDLDDDLQVWSGAQAATFLEFVNNHAWRALWHLAVGTGARRGELLGLRWVDVDLKAAQVRIRRALSVVDGKPRLLGTKTSRTRSLSIGTSVVDALRQHDTEHRVRARASTRNDRWGLVFTQPDGSPIDPMHVTVEFRRIVRQSPVPAIRLHDIRHTHATLLLGEGLPIKVVSERLGHSTIAMTLDVYGHVLPAMDADAAARFDAILSDQ